SSVPKAFEQFDAEGRMKPSSYRDRVVDVMEELFRFTLLLRDNVEVFNRRYSEEKERRELGALQPALGVGAKE
ncbi:MAG TPA: hypothetical protein VGC41_05105, partial [Kofleriaceae bacterium]